MRSRRLAPVLILAVLTGACAASTGVATSAPSTAIPTPSPGCAPTTTNELRAPSLSFDRPCLAVPAGTPSTLRFSNDDAGESHNVAVYPPDSCIARFALKGQQPRCADPLGPVIFRGSVIVGVDATTYDLPAFAPGRYVFLCEVHPFMHGILRVG